MNTFEKYIKENNIDIQLLQTDESTHTAQQAADAHNIPICNIVKSLLTKKDNQYILYLVPGDRRLDLKELNVEMANADEVKEVTGYSIGGVPPFGHITKLKTYILDGFDKKNILLAAGGKLNIVFKISFEMLEELVR